MPLREPGLSAYEMMLSESQERMVIVAKRGREEEVARVYRRWGLEVATIGEVPREPRAEIRLRGRPNVELSFRLEDPDPAAPASRAAMDALAALLIHAIPEVCSAPAGFWQLPALLPYQARF